ncbi:MAG: hypothetical protein WCH61_07725 [bacterium]
MTTEMHQPRRCPACQELNAIHDGQSAPAAVLAHLETCPDCAAVLAVYRRLDQAVAAALRPPASLAERVKSVCRQQSGRSPALGRGPGRPVLEWWPSLRRAAAAVAVIGAAGWLAWITAHPAAPPFVAPADTVVFGQPYPAPETETVVADTAAEPAATDNRDRFSDSTATAFSESSLVSPQHLQLVNVAGDLTTPAWGDSTGTKLPRRIRHVWVVHDPADAERRLETTLPPGAHLERPRNLNSASRNLFRIRLPDRDTQTLVDNLSRAGFSLVSPSLPQPGEGRRLATTGRPVIYEVELVGDTPQ